MAAKEQINEQLIKDDLYMAVNGEWLKTAKIPADKATTGGFQDLADHIEKTLMHDFGEMLDGTVQPEDQYLNEFIKYYRLASDFEKRNADGFTPAKKFMERVENLKDWILDEFTVVFGRLYRSIDDSVKVDINNYYNCSIYSNSYTYFNIFSQIYNLSKK